MKGVQSMDGDKPPLLVPQNIKKYKNDIQTSIKYNWTEWSKNECGKETRTRAAKIISNSEYRNIEAANCG